jgi:hypothetical protein
MKWKRRGKKRSWLNLMYYPGIFLEGLKKISVRTPRIMNRSAITEHNVRYVSWLGLICCCGAWTSITTFPSVWADQYSVLPNALPACGSYHSITNFLNLYPMNCHVRHEASNLKIEAVILCCLSGLTHASGVGDIWLWSNHTVMIIREEIKKLGGKPVLMSFLSSRISHEVTWTWTWDS